VGDRHLKIYESRDNLARGHPGAAPPPTGSAPRGHRQSLDRPAAAVRSLPPPGRPQAHPAGGGRRGRPRVGRVPVGRDDRL